MILTTLKLLKRSWIPFFLLLANYSVCANSITLYTAQGGDFNFMEFVPKLISGDINMEESYFIGLNHNLDIQNTWLNNVTSIVGLSPEFEYQATKHFGIQDNFEVHGALLFRTRNFSITRNKFINFAIGNGISHSFGVPLYEDTADGSKDGLRYKTQNFIALEIEMSNGSAWSIPLRIHHRSGIYGFMAPPKVGSNFIAIGLKKSF